MGECVICGRKRADEEWSHEPGCACPACMLACFGRPACAPPDWRTLRAERDAALAEAVRLRARKDEAFTERNRVVALVCRMALTLGWRAGIATHEDKPGEAWDPEWRTLVSVDLPTGQASWHMHDSHRHLVADLPAYGGAWDGHDTAEKYRRVAGVKVAT